MDIRGSNHGWIRNSIMSDTLEKLKSMLAEQLGLGAAEMIWIVPWAVEKRSDSGKCATVSRTGGSEIRQL